MKYPNEKIMKEPDILMKNIPMKSNESARQPNEILMKYPTEKVMKEPGSIMKYPNEKVMTAPESIMK